MQANSPTCFCLNRDFMPFIPSVRNSALSRTWNCFRRNFFLLLIQHMTTSEHLCSNAKWLQSCLTLCDPMDYSLQVSSVHGILMQEYWSGLPYPPPGDLPDSRSEPESLSSLTLAGGFFTTSTTWEAQNIFTGLVFNSIED